MEIKKILQEKEANYNRAFILENDEITNGPKFIEIDDDLFENYQAIAVRDSFILTAAMIDEIFGKSQEMGLEDKDLVLIIAV